MLSVLSPVVADNSDVQAVYIIGNFNTHIKEPFHCELMDFFSEHEWNCVDIENLDVCSDTYTYISDVQGCER